MIRNFKQFINENHNKPISIHNAINEPFTSFIEKVEERVNMFNERVGELVSEMDNVIEVILSDFADIIIGEPIITVDSDLSEITVEIHTNVPNNDEAWAADESPAISLEHELYNINDDNIYIDIKSTPNEDGNCVISIRKYIVDKDNFGDFTEAFRQLGEE